MVAAIDELASPNSQFAGMINSFEFRRVECIMDY
jgi:hypothetical protein